MNTADFSHNFLQNLPFDLFQKNHIMTHIDLSDNQIRVVPPRLLLGLNVLEEINFSHNLISLVFHLIISAYTPPTYGHSFGTNF